MKEFCYAIVDNTGKIITYSQIVYGYKRQQKYFVTDKHIKKYVKDHNLKDPLNIWRVAKFRLNES